MAGKNVKEDAVAVVTVHGTGDTAKEPDGPKWWQRGSAFSERLKARLAGQGVTAEIVPHFWSGANSASDRENGADTLAVLIKKCAAKYKGVHVVGHSHGGNVANDAADFLRWGRRVRRKGRDEISSVTTVGTPFFNVKTGLPQRFAGLAFMAVTWASVIVFPLTVLVWLVGLIAQYVLVDETIAERLQENPGLAATTTAETLKATEMSDLHIQTGAFLLYVVLIGLAVRFMWRMSTRGIRRVLRPKRMQNAPVSIFSMWHPNDEAISFLQKIEEVPIEAFPKGSLYRGSRSSAVGLGVLAVIALGLGGPSVLVGAPAWFKDDYVYPVLGVNFETLESEGLLIAVLTVAAMLLAPVIFSLFFLLYRYIVGLLLELAARGWLNGRVASTLRGIAYGKDGDQELYKIATTSHSHHTRELVLGGEVAQRMQASATTAANKLLEKYRWSLFSVGADTNASLNQVSTDAMTWDSLIHTTYFDQPEVADAIADHIASEAKRLGEAG